MLIMSIVLFLKKSVIFLQASSCFPYDVLCPTLTLASQPLLIWDIQVPRYASLCLLTVA